MVFQSICFDLVKYADVANMDCF